MRTTLVTPLDACLLAAVYLLTPQTALELEAPQSGYLDAHAHIAGIGAGDGGRYVHPDVVDSIRFGFYLRGFGVTREELKEHGDALGDPGKHEQRTGPGRRPQKGSGGFRRQRSNAPAACG